VIKNKSKIRFICQGWVIHISLILFLVICRSAANAEDVSKNLLPDPLTLEYALSLADEAHPDLLLQSANILNAKANKDSIDASTGFDVSLDVGAYVTDEDRFQSFKNRDHIRAGVIVSKTLYDFGYTDDRVSAAGQLVDSEQWKFRQARGLRRLAISEAYFNVLLSDLQFSQYNEAMSIGYVNFDKVKDRRELGKSTDLEVLERESEYQKLRVLRYKSENLQRSTRARLAEVLNRPNQLPARLAIPRLTDLKRKLPEVELLQEMARLNNYDIKAFKYAVQSAETSLIAARNQNNPKLDAIVTAHEYKTDFDTIDELTAALNFSYDLYQPEQDAAIAAQLSKLYASRARLHKIESALRQSILELWHVIEELSIKREAMMVLLELREIKLEQSRALYEMEVKADLGFSMVELTEAQYSQAQNDYQLALAWVNLDLLTGKLNINNSEAKSLDFNGSRNVSTQ